MRNRKTAAWKRMPEDGRRMKKLIEGVGRRVDAQEMECWMRLCTKALELELTEEEA